MRLIRLEGQTTGDWCHHLITHLSPPPATLLKINNNKLKGMSTTTSKKKGLKGEIITLEGNHHQSELKLSA